MTKAVSTQFNPQPPIPEEKRRDIIKTMLQTGNARAAAELHGVSVHTLRAWKDSKWWPELYAKVKAEHREELAGKLTSLADVALDIMRDRLENGDWILNNKTGEVLRKPVGLRDANQAMNNLMIQANKVDERNEQGAGPDESMADVFKQLAHEFAKFAKKKKDIIDVEFKEVNDAVHDQREA